MITIRKIRTLKPRVQLRRLACVLYSDARTGLLDDSYLEGLMGIVCDSEILSDGDKTVVSSLIARYRAGHDPLAAKDVYYTVMGLLGEELADWDLVDGQGRLDAAGRRQLPHSLFLDRVRSPYNIGAVFRSAESFCVDHIYLRRGCGDVTSPRCARTARGATETVPYTIVDDLEVLKGRTVFALETGGEALSSFSFPEDAVCVIGSEEDGVSADVLGMCSSRVTIEQFGSKGSINVSVACGILLHAWALYGV